MSLCIEQVVWGCGDLAFVGGEFSKVTEYVCEGVICYDIAYYKQRCHRMARSVVIYREYSILRACYSLSDMYVDVVVMTALPDGEWSTERERRNERLSASSCLYYVVQTSQSASCCSIASWIVPLSGISLNL